MIIHSSSRKTVALYSNIRVFCELETWDGRFAAVGLKISDFPLGSFFRRRCDLPTALQANTTSLLFINAGKDTLLNTPAPASFTSLLCTSIIALYRCRDHRVFFLYFRKLTHLFLVFLCSTLRELYNIVADCCHHHR